MTEFNMCILSPWYNKATFGHKSSVFLSHESDKSNTIMFIYYVEFYDFPI